MATPGLCDNCSTFPPNVLMSDLSDGTTRYLCWPCVGGLAEAVIAEVTGAATPAEVETALAEAEAEAGGESGVPAVDEPAPKRPRKGTEEAQEGPTARQDAAPPAPSGE